MDNLNNRNLRMCLGDSGAMIFYVDRFYLSTSRHTSFACQIFSSGGPNGFFFSRGYSIHWAVLRNYNEIRSYRSLLNGIIVIILGMVKI